MRSSLVPAFGLVGALSATGACADEGVFASIGLSHSEYSAQSLYSKADLTSGLKMTGAVIEARTSLPWHLYGLVSVRSEDGEVSGGGLNTKDDYLNFIAEGGLEFNLWLGFKGAVGLNYQQTDLDVQIVVVDQPFTLSINREDYGGRGRLARDLWGYATVSVESNYSPVQEAVGGIFELESGSRFGPLSAALRYGAYPYLTEVALMLRYHFVAASKPAKAPWSATDASGDSPTPCALHDAHDRPDLERAGGRPDEGWRHGSRACVRTEPGLGLRDAGGRAGNHRDRRPLKA
jgi:hypothetical protein